MKVLLVQFGYPIKAQQPLYIGGVGAFTVVFAF